MTTGTMSETMRARARKLVPFVDGAPKTDNIDPESIRMIVPVHGQKHPRTVRVKLPSPVGSYEGRLAVWFDGVTLNDAAEPIRGAGIWSSEAGFGSSLFYKGESGRKQATKTETAALSILMEDVHHAIVFEFEQKAIAKLIAMAKREQGELKDIVAKTQRDSRAQRRGWLAAEIERMEARVEELRRELAEIPTD